MARVNDAASKKSSKEYAQGAGKANKRAVKGPERGERWAAELMKTRGEAGLADALTKAEYIQVSLPRRSAVEQRIGYSVGEIPVRTGPQIAALLAAVGADAAALNGIVFLPHPDATVSTIAHEVVHVLQAQAGTGPGMTVLPEGHAAEREAEYIAGGGNDGTERKINELLSPSTLALRRSDGPAAVHSSGSTELAEAEAFDRAANATPSSTSADEREESAAPSAGSSSSTELDSTESGGADPDGTDRAAEGPSGDVNSDDAADGETVANLDDLPSLAAPEEPARGPNPETVAAADQALAAAQGPPSIVVGAYKDAAPSVKAAMQPALGAALDDRVAEDHQKGADAAPQIAVAIPGESSIPEVAPVRAPAADSAGADNATSEPVPNLELPIAPRPEPYEANNGIAGRLDRRPPQDAGAVGESIDEVRTTDPDIETDPGPPPAVPVEGDADDARMAEGRAAKVAETADARRLATTAVIDGPGPSVVVVTEMTEERELDYPVAPEASELLPSPDAAEFTELGLPEEVVAQVDAEADAPMRESVEAAHTQAAEAETTRDTDRAAAEHDAETKQQELQTARETEQRDAVVAARTDIQGERQQAIDDQGEAVKQLDIDAGAELRDKKGKVVDRRRVDNKSVSDRYAKAKTDADNKLAEGERQAKQKKTDAKNEAKNKKWWERALDFVKKAFSALTEAIGKVFKAVREGITALVNKARDFAKAVIDAAVSFVTDLIDKFASFLKDLVKNVLGKVFPELAARLTRAIDAAAERAKSAVRAVGDKLKAGVDAIADAALAAINKILDVFEAALKAVVGLVGALLTGDWSAALRMILEGVLRLLGIDPASFYGFIGEAMDTIGSIVRHPGQFLANGVNALLEGFKRFGKNFLTHLKAGVIGWLTGALGGAIEIPAQFDLAGVFSLARQIMGLTWDWVREKAARVIGEENVARLEYIGGYIQTLVTEGWSALFERIKEELGGVKDLVFSALKEMLVTKVIIATITWVASLFNPVGAIVKLVQLIWNMYTFIRDQLARMAAIVTAFVSSLRDIAAGVIDPAASRVEEVLGNLVPIAIDLLAKLLGLGSFAPRIRKVIDKIRARVDRAVDRLIDRVLRAFRGGGGDQSTDGDGAADDPAADAANLAAADDELGAPQPLTESDGSQHTLRINVAGSQATLAVHTTPTPAAAWITDYESNRMPTDADKLAKARPLLTEAKSALRAVDPDADRLAAAEAQRAARARNGASGRASTAPTSGGGSAPSEAEVLEGQKRLALAIRELMKLGGGFADVSKFQTNLSAVHVGGQALVRRAVQSVLSSDTNRTAPLIDQAWDVVLGKVIEVSADPIITRPLLRSSQFGAAAQDALADLVGEIGAETAAPDSDAAVDKARRFAATLPDAPSRAQVVSNRIAPALQDDAAARDVVRDALFDQSQFDVLRTLRARVVALLVGASSSGGTNAALSDALKKAGGVVKFLRKMIRNEPIPDHPEIDPTNWDALYSENKEQFSAAFRRANAGQHEWIPTSLVGEVVGFATSSAGDSEAAEMALVWFDVQHKLRSPTRGLIFRPEKYKAETTVVGPDGAPVKWTVLQGHPGAVYAPLSRGARADHGKQQVQGSPEFHKQLVANFRYAQRLATSEGVAEVVDQAQVIFDEWILGASPSLSSSFTQNTDYRTAPRSTEELKYSDLMAQFKAARLGPKAALDAADRAADQARPNR